MSPSPIDVNVVVPEPTSNETSPPSLETQLTAQETGLGHMWVKEDQEQEDNITLSAGGPREHRITFSHYKLTF